VWVDEIDNFKNLIDEYFPQWVGKRCIKKIYGMSATFTSLFKTNIYKHGFPIHNMDESFDPDMYHHFQDSNFITMALPSAYDKFGNLANIEIDKNQIYALYLNDILTQYPDFCDKTCFVPGVNNTQSHIEIMNVALKYNMDAISINKCGLNVIFKKRQIETKESRGLEFVEIDNPNEYENKYVNSFCERHWILKTRELKKSEKIPNLNSYGITFNFIEENLEPETNYQLAFITKFFKIKGLVITGMNCITRGTTLNYIHDDKVLFQLEVGIYGYKLTKNNSLLDNKQQLSLRISGNYKHLEGWKLLL